ncbi:unnamed protein product [Cyberlindnera jadinii]|uniref:DUF3835 domain-containing protein n=1 Tax=Cyberlindnera jadinii (strain ATCC 18201 / CBS 1600 / BCRC 20928 / JCM 3617 / NBRC 0987 / NRRL Y-1542) TaxID=983966 RepID=A0A0H5C022_CYBJN|nr:unnamed protein product [Cyberlindnera jadinii]
MEGVEDPMAQIRAKVNETVESLQRKKELLVSHRSQYEDLKFKLFDYAQMSKESHPQITVQMTSKAKVKARVVDPSKILVFLGCEYFVERDPQSAVDQVETRLKYLTTAIHEFETKIKEAKKTVENIDTLVQYESERETSTDDRGAQNAKNEEGLAFMDIREELDEEGNVISSSVNPQDEKRLHDFGKEHGVDSKASEMTELEELMEDMGISKTPEPKIKEIEDIAQLPDLGASEPANDAVEEFIKESVVEENIEEVIEEVDDTKEVKDTTGTKDIIESTETTDDEPKEDNDQHPYFALLREMGIRSITESKLCDKDDTTNSSHGNIDKSASSVEDGANEYDPSKPAIDPDDILQLQIIADEFDEDDVDFDDLEYGFDQDDSTDEDTDGDWDISYESKALVPPTSMALFKKELEKMRNEKTQGKETINEAVVDDIFTEGAKAKKKKSVSFAKELQIKEVENISEELKRNQKAQSKVSKFKQMRNSKIPISETNKYVKEDKVVEEESITSDIVERDIVETFSGISEVTENGKEAKPKRLSKFKAQHSLLKPKTRAPTTPTCISPPVSNVEVESESTPELDYESIKAYVLRDEDEEDGDFTRELSEGIEVYNPELDDEDSNEINMEEEEQNDELDDGPIMLDEIVENDEVDDPDYYVNDNIIAKEYSDLRKKMLEKYGDKSQSNDKEPIVVIKHQEEKNELEPIDEHGNPIKVSRFKKSLSRR